MSDSPRFGELAAELVMGQLKLRDEQIAELKEDVLREKERIVELEADVKRIKGLVKPPCTNPWCNNFNFKGTRP